MNFPHYNLVLRHSYVIIGLFLHFIQQLESYLYNLCIIFLKESEC